MVGLDVVDPLTGGVDHLGQVLGAVLAPCCLLFLKGNVGPHSSLVDGLARSQIVPQRSLLHQRTVALAQLVEHLHLLPAHVQRLVEEQPGDGLPAAGVGGAALVRDVVHSVGQQAGQGELVHPGAVSPVLDLGQFGDQPAQSRHRLLPGRTLPSHLEHDGDAQDAPGLLLGLTEVAVELTVVAVQLELPRPALLVDGVLAAARSSLATAPVEEDLLGLVLVLQWATSHVDTNLARVQSANSQTVS